MAPGYEIALWLEGIGLLGLVVGALRLRAEEAARGRALRTVLRTGPDQHHPRAKPRADRTRMVPHRSGARPDGTPSAAAGALARAFGLSPDRSEPA